MALVASDPALLNTESTPLRLYVKELRPTAQNGLEITVRRWWVGQAAGGRAGLLMGLAPGSGPTGRPHRGTRVSVGRGP